MYPRQTGRFKQRKNLTSLICTKDGAMNKAKYFYYLTTLSVILHVSKTHATDSLFISSLITVVFLDYVIPVYGVQPQDPLLGIL
jgi:hypothetical protein